MNWRAPLGGRWRRGGSGRLLLVRRRRGGLFVGRFVQAHSAGGGGGRIDTDAIDGGLAGAGRAAQPTADSLIKEKYRTWK